MGGLATGPPSPPDARRAPAKPWRSSILRHAPRLRPLRAGALLLLAVALSLPAGAAAQAPAPPQVTRFSPQGVVKGVRQVTARFSAPMVPLGDPRPATEVFEVTCPALALVLSLFGASTAPATLSTVRAAWRPSDAALHDRHGELLHDAAERILQALRLHRARDTRSTETLSF